MDQLRWNAALAHRERLLRIARARLGASADVEDVVQEAMLRCVEYEDLDLARIGPFLSTVTVRLCADVRRRSEEPERARRWLTPLLQDAADPADLVCRGVESEVVASLVADLPERQRTVLIDRASGMSIPQISARHKLTYKSVESALSRARAAMRAAVTASLALGALLVRHRRAATAVAVPATALTLVALVMVSNPPRLPAGDAPPGANSRPRAVVPAGGPRQLPADGAGAAQPAPAVPDARPAGVAIVPEAGQKPLVGGRNDTVWVDPDNDDDSHVERVLDCVNYGPNVEVRPEDRFVGFECRRAPAQ